MGPDKKKQLSIRTATWLLRIALASTLLSAVADRFGLWGPFGTMNVSWGDWGHFVNYCARVNSFFPSDLAVLLAWIATILEIVLALGLLSGSNDPLITYGSAALFAMFALAMSISFGVKAPLNFSVFCDSAAALLLAVSVTPDSALGGLFRKLLGAGLMKSRRPNRNESTEIAPGPNKMTASARATCGTPVHKVSQLPGEGFRNARRESHGGNQNKVDAPGHRQKVSSKPLPSHRAEA